MQIYYFLVDFPCILRSNYIFILINSYLEMATKFDLNTLQNSKNYYFVVDRAEIIVNSCRRQLFY